jgi:hypothetical protein
MPERRSARSFGEKGLKLVRHSRESGNSVSPPENLDSYIHSMAQVLVLVVSIPN